MWESAEKVQKSASGEYRAMINGEWVPVAKAQKSPSGEYRIERTPTPESTPVEKPLTWGEVPAQAIGNIPSSLGRMGMGIAQTVAHPIDTAGNLLDVAAGGLRNATPDFLRSVIDKIDPNPQAAQVATEKADQVGQFYKSRYGSEEGFKQAIANDPAGVAADAATVLTLGGGAINKAGQLSNISKLQQAGQFATKAGRAIDPMLNAVKAVKGATGLMGKAAGHMVGLQSGTGNEALSQAYKAGKSGGVNQAALIDNMRGNVPQTDVLNTIDANIQAMGKARSADYTKGMAALGKNTKPLSFAPIEKAAKDSMNVSTYTGKNSGIQVSTARSTLGVQKELADLINEWKKLPAKDFHTAEGLDALKKNIGDLRDSTPYGTPARLAADKVYHAVKNEITKLAPDYAKTMKDYQNASDTLHEIRNTLSVKPNASIDTQMRKLQSLMRNNVNTNYGNRLDMVKQMEAQGGNQVLPAVAGQALNSWTPRGLQRASAIPGAAAVGYLANPLAGVASLAASSPRLMGETALKAGQINRYTGAPFRQAGTLLDRLNIDPVIAANLLYQANQPKASQ